MEIVNILTDAECAYVRVTFIIKNGWFAVCKIDNRPIHHKIMSVKFWNGIEYPLSGVQSRWSTNRVIPISDPERYAYQVWGTKAVQKVMKMHTEL